MYSTTHLTLLRNVMSALMLFLWQKKHNHEWKSISCRQRFNRILTPLDYFVAFKQLIIIFRVGLEPCRVGLCFNNLFLSPLSGVATEGGEGPDVPGSPIHTMGPPPPPFDFWLCTLHCDAFLLPRPPPPDESLPHPFVPPPK